MPRQPQPKPAEIYSDRLVTLLQDREIELPEFSRLIHATFVCHSPIEAQALLDLCDEAEIGEALEEIGLFTADDVFRIIHEQSRELLRRSVKTLLDYDQPANLRWRAYAQICNELENSDPAVFWYQINDMFSGDTDAGDRWFNQHFHPELFCILMEAWDSPYLSEGEIKGVRNLARVLITKITDPVSFFSIDTHDAAAFESEERFRLYINKRFGAGRYEELVV